ncbi:glutamine synthetase [Streptomyces sp. NPDC059142]|uniref:glutamine synthetase n=1 Tax=Streptomyces sp. NPDC059142 TaxID=3346739 RepID=UPI0036852735
MTGTPLIQEREQVTGPDPEPWHKTLRGLVERGEVDTVLLALTDMSGEWRGKPLDAADFLRRAETTDPAWPLCAYVLATDRAMSLHDDFALVSLGTGLHDLHLKPAPGTLRVLPWRNATALITADAVHPDGTPITVAPRQILQDQITRLSQHGLTAHTGLEAEWTVYQGSPENIARSRRLNPVVDRSLDLALNHPQALAAYMRSLRTALTGAGLPPRTVQSEHGPGQFEATFAPSDPLTAADTHLVLQDAVRHHSYAAGWTALFMAAPTADGATNGLHLHLSLRRTDHQLLPTSGNHRLPDLLRDAVAGLLAALPHLTPLLAPTVNSYKRFRPDSGAPVSFGWGWDNRTCAIRALDHGGDLRLEIRLAGADANAYLALAAVLAAVRHGVEHRLPLPEPHTGNAYHPAPDTQSVPRTLTEALTAFQDSPLAIELFTQPVITHYATALQHEIDTHHHTITDTELHQALTTA